MTDIDFDFAAKKFARDQDVRKKKEESKRAQVAAERARTQALQQRWQQDLERKREEEARKAAEAARQLEEDLERNRGVAYRRSLRPLLSLAGEAKGIVRRSDKLTLPPSAQAALMEQQATKNGQLFFELSTIAGAMTHASILDFSAAEGTVGLPPDVLRCLNLAAAPEGSAVQPIGREMNGLPEVLVRYRYLKKGRFARFQPELSAFQSEVSDVKSLLESELMLRTTLSVGDQICVRHGDESYLLRVVQLEPDAAVSLIDTDLEVELLPSVQAEEAEAARQQAERRMRELVERRRQEEEAAAAAEKQRVEEEAAAASGRREERRVAARTLLDALATSRVADGGPVEGRWVSVAIRCPDGSRCTAKFHHDDPLAALFLLVEAEWRESSDAELLQEQFELASSFPRRVYQRVEGVTLAESGLVGAQEALFVQNSSST